MSFAGRLVLGTFTVVVLTLLVLILGSERTLRSSLERDVRTGLEREARLVAELLPENPDRWQAVVDRMSAQNSHRIVVRDSSGATRAASDSLLGSDVLRVEVRGGPGSIMVATATDGVSRAVARARRSMIGAALLALLVALVLATVAGRSIASPLVSLSSAAHAIAAGAQPRFPRSGIPEVDTLSQALRQMHRDLADRFDDLQREKAATTAIVDAMGEGIIATDARGRVVVANPAARRLLGYSEHDPLPEVRTLFRVKSAREAVGEVLEGRLVQDREVDLDGRTIVINARAVEGQGVVLILRDLTEVRRLEAIRRDFVANVSHELKTPLTSISGYAETLAAGGVDRDTEARFLQTILTNARRMQVLVDDLLDLSRIESGRWTPHPEPLVVDVAVTEAWSMFADRADAGGIRFEAQLDPDADMIHADPDALRQILGNLFDNALRYVDRGGQITASAHREDGGVELSVEDDGLGIPSEHLPRIFERFYRVDPSRSRDEGGTGLGLSIVRHMMEAHGGRVRAESTHRQGTTIRCWFPDR